MMKKLLLLITCIIFASHSSLAEATKYQAQVNLDVMINAALKDWGVPGASVAIIEDGKIVSAKGYGVKTLGQANAVDGDTVFAIASVTKTFTSAAIAVLVSEGKISWDDKVIKHLPTFKLHDPIVTNKITIRDLLAHRTCIQSKNMLTFDSSITRSEIIERLRFLEADCEFREQFVYNNLMFVVAGEIVAAVSGKSWSEFIQDTFLNPLEMNATTPLTTNPALSKNLATPYMKKGGELTEIPLFNEDNTGPAGSIHSSAADMAKWLEMQLNKGKYSQTRFWDEKTDTEMHRAQTIIDPNSIYGKLYPESKFLSYGLGWFTYSYQGDVIVEHLGQSDGMQAVISMMPEKNIGIVVLSNTSLIGFTSAIVSSYYDAHAGRNDNKWSSKFLTTFQPFNDSIDIDMVVKNNPQIKDTKPSLEDSEYVGNFHSNLLGDLVFSQNDKGYIFVEFSGREGTLSHWHHNTFRIKWSNSFFMNIAGGLVTFDIGLDGSTTAVTFNSGDKFERAK